MAIYYFCEQSQRVINFIAQKIAQKLDALKFCAMETLQERLISLRGESSRRSFAENLGINESTLRNYEKGVSSPDAQFMTTVCKKLRISPMWLLFGEDPLQEEIKLKSSEEDLISIPIVEARLSAGTGSLQVSDKIEHTKSFPSSFLRRKGNPRTMVMMCVEGDSMQPEIMDGDMVLIDQSQKDIRLGRIFAVGFEDAIYLKRIDKLPGKIILKSVNPAYPPLEFDISDQLADSFRVIGQVLWCGREYR